MMHADDAPLPTVPVDPETLAAWQAELAAIVGADAARRSLACVAQDRVAAGLLVGFWRGRS